MAPDTTTLHYGQCPACGKECFTDPAGPEGEPCVIEIKNRRHVETDYGPGENWTEVWKCDGCNETWEESNGYP